MATVTKQGIRIGGAYVEITADSTKLDAALQQAQSTTKAISDTVLHAGTGLTAIGGAIMTPVVKAADVYADFERAMKLTQSVTKATQTQFASLTAQAKELGATTSWTATQVAEGMLSLGRMGFDADEINKIIGSVMDLGRALDIDVYDSAKMLGSTMNQFGASMDEAAHFADALATATNGAAISSDELLESLKYIGAAANGLGADVETVLALTMALRNSGISASQAGTQLRSMFLKMQKPKTMEIFGEKFGVEVYDAQGRLRSMLDIFVDAQEKAAQFGDQLPVIMDKVFGRLVAPGALTLLNTKELKQFRDMLYECDGAAAALRGNMEGGVFGSLKRVESAIEAVGIQLTETLVPALTRVSERTIGFAGYMKEMVAANPGVANALTEQASCAVAVGAALMAGSGAMKGYSMIATGLTGSLKTLVATWKTMSINIKETNAQIAAGNNVIVKYSAGVTALRVAAVALKRALAGIGTGLLVAGVWEAMVLAFKTVSDYATKTAKEMKEAREQFEKMSQQDTKNADELTRLRTSYEEKIRAFVAAAGSDKPLNPVEKRRLDMQYEELEKAGFMRDDDVVKDASTPSGYRVTHAGAEAGIVFNMMRDLLEEYRDKYNASKIDMSAIDPNRYQTGTEMTFGEAQKELEGFYKPLADAFSHLSNAQIYMMSEKTLWGLGDNFIDAATRINKEMMDAVRAAPSMAQDANERRDERLRQLVDEIIVKIKGAGDLTDEDENALREFLWRSGRTFMSPNNDPFFKNVVGDYGKAFMERVATAFGGSNLQKALEDTEKFKEAWYDEWAEQKGAPYESAADKERRETQQEQAELDRKATFDKQTEEQNKEEEARRSRFQTQSENALDRLDKEWADYLERLREATVAKLSEIERQAFEESGASWESLLTDAERERFGEQRQRYQDRRDALEILAANERTEKTQGVAVDDIKEASKAFSESLSGGSVEKAIELGQNLDGLIAAATQNGYDITEARRAIVEDIQNAVASMGQYKLDSRSTFDAFEAMEMDNAFQLDVQKSQLNQLRQLASSAKAILTQLQNDDEYKEFF